MKLKKIPAGDLYAQLAILGEESAGAFSIVNQSIAKKRHPHYQKYSIEQLNAEIKLMSKNLPLQFQHAQLRLSLAGAQNKLPVKYVDNSFWLPC